MNLKHLLFFKELARTQHMSQAAANLGITQPTLSYAMDKLEQELGVPLFEKDGRNIKLTVLGKTYLTYITKGLNELDRGKAILAQSMDPNAGQVALGFTYTMGQRLIPETVTQFQQQNQDQHVDFHFTQGNTPDLLTQLLKEDLDLVVASYIPKITDQTATNSLTFQPLVQQQIMLAAAPDHPLAQQASVAVKDLAPYPLIGFAKNSGLRPLMNRIFQQAQVQPKIIAEIEEDHTIVGFVQYGYGIALVPNLPQLDQRLVRLIPLKDNTIQHQIYLVYRANSFMTPAVRHFKDFISTYCASQYTAKNKLL
ncbi:MAG: LysR family transcriptional regulator [Lactobacillus sp.]|jgi:DNA-binding transcriptional LysR family regulator|nr:LysR family transcriptional regulator [Lactobacillus sp.]